MWYGVTNVMAKCYGLPTLQGMSVTFAKNHRSNWSAGFVHVNITWNHFEPPKLINGPVSIVQISVFVPSLQWPLPLVTAACSNFWSPKKAKTHLLKHVTPDEWNSQKRATALFVPSLRIMQAHWKAQMLTTVPWCEHMQHWIRWPESRIRGRELRPELFILCQLAIL